MLDNHNNTYQLIQNNLDSIIPDYENNESPLEMMKQQTDFLNETSQELRNLANSAKSQANSAKTIAENSKLHAEAAIKQSKKSDIKSWLSIIIAAFGVFIEFSVHRTEIFEFIKSLLAK